MMVLAHVVTSLLSLTFWRLNVSYNVDKDSIAKGLNYSYNVVFYLLIPLLRQRR